MSVSAAVLVFRTQGAAFLAVHLAGLQDSVEVLEMIPNGQHAQVLLKGPFGALENLVRQLPFADFEKVSFVSEWDLRIEKAFYNLENAAPQGGLLFIEGAWLGPLFQAASDGLKAGLQIVELKIPRGSVKWGLLVLTGKIDESHVKSALTSGCHVTHVSEPSKLLQKYFSVEAL